MDKDEIVHRELKFMYSTDLKNLDDPDIFHTLRALDYYETQMSFMPDNSILMDITLSYQVYEHLGYPSIPIQKLWQLLLALSKQGFISAYALYQNKMEDILEISLEFPKISEIKSALSIKLNPSFQDLLTYHSNHFIKSNKQYLCSLSLSDNALSLKIDDDDYKVIKTFHDESEYHEFFKKVLNSAPGITLSSTDIFPSKRNLKQVLLNSGLGQLRLFFDVLSPNNVKISSTKKLTEPELNEVLREIKGNYKKPFMHYLESQQS